MVAAFVADLAVPEKEDLETELQDFVKRHQKRPIALVTSGGTVANLELNAVRCLDNFSTGLRGAISVEEFLKHGYAVIHLWRKGSASPYARVLNQLLELEQANYAVNNQSLDKLFESTKTTSSHMKAQTTPKLHYELATSSKLNKKLQERARITYEGRILTIPFWSVEEYLAKLQLCAKALRPCGSTAILYLAAAVSDFYVPKSERSEHKISSNTTKEGVNDDEGDAGGLVLTLRPVPKVLGLIRTSWAPDAYVVSFKLETDHAILRQKAERAVIRYGCHMVIGNLLATRHTQVWLLSPPLLAPMSMHPSGTSIETVIETTDVITKTAVPVNQWPMRDISKPNATPAQTSTPQAADDSLEEALIDVVVESHMKFLSVLAPDSEALLARLRAENTI